MAERILTLEGNLGYGREEMPQIHSALIGHYILWLLSKGIDVSEIHKIPVKDVKPTQVSVNLERVDRKAELGSLEPTNLKTLIISKDGHQLDGHNTIQALKSIGCENLYLPCYRVRVSMHELIEVSRDYPHVTYKSLKDVE